MALHTAPTPPTSSTTPTTLTNANTPPAPVTGVDVWVEGDPALLGARLEEALASSAGRVTTVEPPSASLWPLPVGATTHRTRVRVLVTGDDHDIAEVLGNIAAVAPWSLVHRVGTDHSRHSLHGHDGPESPALH